ncbi:hypothetical protein EV182_005405, partial [Spiromyces aspiralis]
MLTRSQRHISASDPYAPRIAPGKDSSGQPGTLAAVSHFPVPLTPGASASRGSFYVNCEGARSPIALCQFGSEWLGPLFADLYSEQGLVLDTADTLRLVGLLISAMSAIHTPDCSDGPDLGPGSVAEPSTNASGKGKAAEYGSATLLSPCECVVVLARELGDLLAKNRHFVLASRAAVCTFGALLKGEAFAATTSAAGFLGASEDGAGRGQQGGKGLLVFDQDNPGLLRMSLSRTLKHSHVDYMYALACLLAIPYKDAYHELATSISNAAGNPRKVAMLADIGKICARVWQQHAMLARCTEVSLAARWGEQLRLLGIVFDMGCLKPAEHERLRSIVPLLLENSALDVNLALGFADTFNISGSHVALEYIKLCCTIPTVDGYDTRVVSVVDEVPNKELLRETLTHLLHHALHPYDYPRLNFVLGQLLAIDPGDRDTRRSKSILDALRHYTRRHAPGESELERAWRQLQSPFKERVLKARAIDITDGIPAPGQLSQL